MPNNNQKNNNRNYKKNYRPHPPKNVSHENNSATQEKTNEYSSCSAIYQYSDFFSGMNIFELYSDRDLAALVKDPMGNNKMLRDISIMLYGTNGVYTNTVDYLTAMPTLDKVVVPHGNSKNKKRQNRILMESTLRVIRDKEFIRDALFKGMVEGAAYYYFETTDRLMSNKKFMSDYDVESICEINDVGKNASIISLPADYTKIVGIKNSSYVLAFNLDYFDKAYGEVTEKKLRKYPKEIRDAYTARRNSSQKSGNWVVLDNTKTITHKIRSKRDERYGRPLVLAAISDILYSEYFTKTKHNVLDEINNRIIYQTFPEGKEKGTSALTKQQQENQHDAVKSAVMNKNSRGGISFFSVASGTKINSIDTNNTDIFDDKYESNLNDKISLDMGIASSLLNGSASGSYSAQENNLEMLTSQLFQWIEQIQAELNKCISENIICDKRNWVEVVYLPMTHVNKGKMVGYAKELYLQGKGSLSLWASACGIPTDAFFALLDRELEDDIENRYPTHQTSFTMSKDDNKGGRPMTDNPSEKTIASRGNNGNALPSPGDKK